MAGASGRPRIARAHNPPATLRPVKLLAPIALLITLLLVVVWMDDTPDEADFVFVNQNEVFTLDPQRMSYLQDLRLAHALYEGLERWDNDTFEFLPATAVGPPKISKNGKVYTYVLRPEAKWSNGDPVTAHDFIYAWQRAIVPDTAADYSNLFFVIKGAADFFEWRGAQTRAFAARPWDDPTKANVGGMAARLRTLLALDPLPAGIAPPPDRAAIARELDRLAISADGDESSSSTLVAIDAPNARAWFDALDANGSRRAEAEWMWRAAEEEFASTVQIKAIDEHTLRIELAQPTAYFRDLLCFGTFFPVHRPTVEGWPDGSWDGERGWFAGDPPPFAERRWLDLNARTGRLQQRHEWAKPGRHVGNGPYDLAQWRYKRDLRLEKSDTFYDKDRVLAESVLALTIEDTNTAVLAFESGRVDWLADVSTEYQTDMIAERDAYLERHWDAYQALLAEGKTIDEALAALPPPEAGERRNIHVFPTFGTDFYSFNCRPRLSDGRPNPFADRRVRRAFAMATDKKIIVERVTRLNEPVLDTLIPPDTILDYKSPKGLSYDVDAARASLEEAGWVVRDGRLMKKNSDDPFPVIDLLYTTNIPRYKWISLDLKAQWEHELGVRVELRGTETKFYKEDLKQGKFMIARGRWYGDYGDPTTFLDLNREKDGNNDRRYVNPDFEAQLRKAASMTDPQARLDELTDCERTICEDVPMLPICQLVQVYMYEPGRVKGLSNHPRLTQFLWRLEVDEP